MARPFNSRYFPFLLCCLLALICLPFIYPHRITNSTFNFNHFGQDSPHFESHLALYGHAKVVSTSIEISTGRVVYKKPINLFDGYPTRLSSFSTNFSFSISSGKGVVLAFFMVPIGFPLDSFGDMKNKNKTVLVEFYTFMNNSNKHVRVNINGSASNKSANLSSLNPSLNEDNKKLQTWIDYQAGSKRIEIRVGRTGEIKPIEPLLSYRIDLSQVWKEGEMLVGISSSTTNTSKTSNVYSWSFQMRYVPNWMHSFPVDPNSLPEKTKTPISPPPKQKECLFRILSALLFGTACGAAGASFALFLSTILRNRPQPVAPEEMAEELEYKKLNIVAVDQQSIKDGKM
ncbi:L-type lectin-domain containing receptor kinase IV.3-like [Impatiens glandulifera]|uniref:L-type lectin-domain containing receptor kinase IV.3-like n=1 Tax=Impatiens glandulifera TaxID=253017 RepID=UPI001FB1946D|nr:L-type lectin-domain containing receptor kinase IV.3-like [Impatiens glandulifera]